MTNNTEEREPLRTVLLDDLWLLKTTLEALPRHLDHSEEQFEAGFAAECQIRWLPPIGLGGFWMVRRSRQQNAEIDDRLFIVTRGILRVAKPEQRRGAVAGFRIP